MYAIIESGGRQYRVEEGDVVRLSKLSAAEGEVVQPARILAVGEGDQVKVGSPVVETASVDLRVLSAGRGPKVIVFKYKPKKNYRRKHGHRQGYTEVKVETIREG